ncbi:MAG TPA: hypothetical protein PKA58_37870 [Polyangium sp.]|jgi:hypothetical protein|nr:hypothetical protein [Polyangium sp.]
MATLGRGFLRLSNATGIRRFGEQLTWIQEPDIFHICLTGTLEAADLKKIIDWQVEWGKQKPRFFIVCDVRQLRSVSREARQYATQLNGSTTTQVITIAYGASFGLRIAMEMMSRARRIMGMRDGVEVVFMATEADALAEVEKRREHS